MADVSATLDRHRLNADAGGLQPGSDLLAGRDGVNELNQLGRLRLASLKLDASVQVFGVLTDDDQIDLRLLEVRSHPCVCLAGSNTGIETEFLSQRDVDRSEPLADRSRDRSLESDLVRSDRSKD